MTELIKLLRSKCDERGELHLTHNHAAHLIRWIEICEQQVNNQEALINDLRKHIDSGSKDKYVMPRGYTSYFESCLRKTDGLENT